MPSNTPLMSSASLKPSVTCVEHAQLLGHRADCLVVALRLAHRLDGLAHVDDGLEAVAVTQVEHDVVDFERGVGRQDDVGVEAVVLQPGMLGHDALDLGAQHGFAHVVAAVPAGHPAGRVGPHHVELGAALFLRDGIGVLLVLVGRRLLVAAGAPEVHGPFLMASSMSVLGMSCLPQAWACRGAASAAGRRPASRPGC